MFFYKGVTRKTKRVGSFKNNKMKNLLILAIMPFTIGVVKAQKVYTENVASRADVKVYVETVESRADLLVFKESVDSRADKSIYFENVASRADLKICFTDVRSRAGWKNSSKKSLMY